MGDALVRGILLLFSFEFVFVLFLTSGSFKQDLRLASIKIDLAILLGAISLVQGFWIVAMRRSGLNRQSIPCTLAGAAFCLYAYISQQWSPSVDYAGQKALRLCTINLWCLFAGAMIMAVDRDRAKRFVMSILIVSTWMSVECVLFYAANIGGGPVYSVDVLAGEGGYIGLGRAVATGVVLLGAGLLVSRQSRSGDGTATASLFNLALFNFLTMGVLLIGARGPTIAAIAALIATCLSVHFSKQSTGRTRTVFVLAAAAIGIYLILWVCQTYLGDLPLAIRRLLVFSESSEYYDAGGSGFARIELVRAGFDLWWQEPFFGWGLGSFSVLDGEYDARHYCHNSVAEILCELGLFGLLLAAATVWLALQAGGRKLCAIRRVFIALFVYALVNSFISGDLPDNRLLFLATGLLVYQSAETRCKPNVALRRPISRLPAK
jgi:O-antigen ligase